MHSTPLTACTILTCRRNGIAIEWVVADAPMRAKLRGISSHGGYYACDWCVASAKPFNGDGTANIRRTPAQAREKRKAGLYTKKGKLITLPHVVCDATGKRVDLTTALQPKKNGSNIRVWPFSTLDEETHARRSVAHQENVSISKALMSSLS